MALCGIRFGKSDAAAARFLWRMFYRPGGKYLNAAFSQDQANIVVERAYAMASSGPLAPCVEKFARSPHPTLILKNGASLQSRSTDDANLLRGRAYHGINVDEGAFARPDDIEVLRGRTIDYAGWLSMTTTPKGKNFVFPLYTRAEAEQRAGNPLYFAMTGTTWDNPMIPRAEIERIQRDYPDRTYRQEIMGEFVDLEGATFPLEILDRMFQPVTPETSPLAGRVYAAGWDLGRKTTQSVGTVLDASETLRGVHRVRLTSAPWPTIASSIDDTATRWGAQTVIDSTGVGDAVMAMVNVHVSPFIFTAKSRANLITGLQAVAHRGEIIVPRDWTELYTQMQLHTWEEDADGMTWDDLDSLMLAVHHAREVTFRGPALIRL